MKHRTFKLNVNMEIKLFTSVSKHTVSGRPVLNDKKVRRTKQQLHLTKPNLQHIRICPVRLF